MDALARLRTWWATLSPQERRQASALALIAFGYIVHYAVFCIAQPFFIEFGDHVRLRPERRRGRWVCHMARW